jgi:dTMP kinase
MAKTLPRGAVIMIDGPDGIGKTTQVSRAVETLKQQGYGVWQTRVNGGTPMGEALRSVMLLEMERPVMTDLHIHLAQQYALAAELERRRHEQTVVVIDRSPLSVIAYQVYGSGLDKIEGYATAEKVFELLKPDSVITYTASLDVMQRRLKTAGHPHDYFESKTTDYFLRVLEGYADATKRYGATVIDGTPDIDSVHAATMKEINAVLAQAANAAPSSSGSGH